MHIGIYTGILGLRYILINPGGTLIHWDIYWDIDGAGAIMELFYIDKNHYYKFLVYVVGLNNRHGKIT